MQNDLSELYNNGIPELHYRNLGIVFCANERKIVYPEIQKTFLTFGDGKYLCTGILKLARAFADLINIPVVK